MQEGWTDRVFVSWTLASSDEVNREISKEPQKNNLTLSMLNVSQSDLGNLEALLLNNTGNVPLHNRFRALFTLKAFKSEEAVRIISKGGPCSHHRR